MSGRHGDATMPDPLEAPDVAELRRTLGLSIRNVLRSELGYEQPFDPHSWRCADKVRYPGPCGCADEVADMAVLAAASALIAIAEQLRKDRP